MTRKDCLAGPVQRQHHVGTRLGMQPSDVRSGANRLHKAQIQQKLTQLCVGNARFRHGGKPFRLMSVPESSLKWEVIPADEHIAREVPSRLGFLSANEMATNNQAPGLRSRR